MLLYASPMHLSRKNRSKNAECSQKQRNSLTLSDAEDIITLHIRGNPAGSGFIGGECY